MTLWTAHQNTVIYGWKLCKDTCTHKIGTVLIFVQRCLSLLFFKKKTCVGDLVIWIWVARWPSFGLQSSFKEGVENQKLIMAFLDTRNLGFGSWHFFFLNISACPFWQRRPFLHPQQITANWLVLQKYCTTVVSGWTRNYSSTKLLCHKKDASHTVHIVIFRVINEGQCPQLSIFNIM